MEQVEDDIPPGDLLIDGCCRFDFVSETFSKPLENEVGSEGDAKRCSEDQWSVVKFFNDSMRPGKQFLVVHDQLVRSCEGFAVSVLDGANYSFNSSDPGVVFG